ncbi:putative endo-polygalacturonase [Helianthus debilis subsp. tardiflorus]
MNTNLLKAACICFVFSYFLFSCEAASYNVVRFGARADGRTDSSQAFVKAWRAACASRSSSTVYIPRGVYMTKPVVFSGPCWSRILFQIDGTLVAPPNYWDMGNSGFWILFTKVSRLTVHGGVIDARGAKFWACRRSGSRCPPGVRVSIYNICPSVVEPSFNLHKLEPGSFNLKEFKLELESSSIFLKLDELYLLNYFIFIYTYIIYNYNVI